METSKARVRLALDFQEEPGLRKAITSPQWGDLEATVGTDVAAVAAPAQDAEALVLLARWRYQVDKDGTSALSLACRATELNPALYEGQLRCGDYQRLVQRDIPAAVARWVAAFPLAITRDHQCQVVERLTAHSLSPEVHHAQMSPTVVTFCQQRQQEALRRAEATKLLELNGVTGPAPLLRATPAPFGPAE